MSVGGIILLILLGIICSIGGIILYFLPAIIAYKRGHANKNIILLITFLLGWTFLGWAGCLVWAFFDNDGSTINKMFRNVGGNKYDDLEKLQKLKEKGAISDSEYELEKQRLLK